MRIEANRERSRSLPGAFFPPHEKESLLIGQKTPWIPSVLPQTPSPVFPGPPLKPVLDCPVLLPPVSVSSQSSVSLFQNPRLSIAPSSVRDLAALLFPKSFSPASPSPSLYPIYIQPHIVFSDSFTAGRYPFVKPRHLSFSGQSHVESHARND